MLGYYSAVGGTCTKAVYTAILLQTLIDLCQIYSSIDR